jgi:hydrogenase expression/formation protein HypE
MRDITRGGLAGILNEMAGMANIGIEVEESAIPVSEPVKGFCEMLGYDMYHFASEGKCIFIINPTEAERVLSILRADEKAKDAAMIGTITKDHPGEVVIRTSIGGRRLMSAPLGTQVPRIC